jgi:aryl-alcohol dehydrogenase-like predicted oxidoreductase
VAPSERDHLSLAEVVEVAREAAGDRHHFRFIQLPFNLAKPEAYALRNQHFGKQSASTLELAAREGVMVVGSASLYQGHLTSGLPDFVGQRLGMESDAANAIQFARSAPGLAVALVGMGRKQHVEENIQVAARPPAPAEEWKKLFTRAA